MSINESVQSGINVKEQIRLRNEEVKRKEEAQFRLVAKSVQKTDTTSPSLSNLYSTLNSSYSIGGHYSSLKTKKEDGSHYIPSVNGQKKHNSLYSLSSENIGGNGNQNPNVLVLNIRDINSKLNLSDGNEFALTLNEPIYEGELDKSKMCHLAEYFKLEYNDALKDALRTINMERKFEQRRRKNQDERWESLIKEGRGPSTTELELQRKDREKIDIMSKNREIEVTNCVKKNFENKLAFETEVNENIDNLLNKWKGKQWSELIDYLENGSDESSEEEDSNESSNNEESESESTSEKEDTRINYDENNQEIKDNLICNKEVSISNSTNLLEENKSNVCGASLNGSLEILNLGDGEECRKSELKIEQRLKKSLQSLKHGIEEDNEIQNKCQSLTSVVANENQEKMDEEEKESKEDIDKVVNDVEKTIQNMLQCNEELQSELKRNIEIQKSQETNNKNLTQDINKVDDDVEKVEVINVIEQNSQTNVESSQLYKSNEGLLEQNKELYSSRGSLTQINTSIASISSSSQLKNLDGNTTMSAVEFTNENNSKKEQFNEGISNDDKLISAPPVLEDDNNPKLLSPNTADNLKSINPLHRSQNNLKTDIPYILKHQNNKALTYDYIKSKNGKIGLSNECRLKVASEVIQILENGEYMRASESTPLVAEPGVSILKRIMKKLKKNKPSDVKYDNEVDYQSIDLFGSHLDLLFEIYKDIPPFLKKCKKYIKAKGIKKQGIFRISGKSGDIKDLKNRFQHELDYKDIGRQVNYASKINNEKLRQERIDYIKAMKKKLQPESHVDLFELSPTESSVASVFKSFFRELIEPIFTFRMYKLWILLDDIQDKSLKIKLSSHLILLLPFTYRLMLHYLLHFLSTVASYSEFNDMTSSNLAKVFSPNLLRVEEKKKDKPSVELHEKANKVIEFLIDNYQEIYEAGSELIVTFENEIKSLYDEEDQNTLAKSSYGKSKSHFSITKVSKSQTKSNRNSNLQAEENKKSSSNAEEK